MSTRRQFLIVGAVWLGLVAVTFPLDGAVARWAHWNAADKHHPGNVFFKMPGEFRFTLAVMLALATWHARRGYAALDLLLSGLLGGAIYTVAKWLAGRQRPVVGIRPFEFDPFINGLRGFLGAENMSFPSGHATLAFATAACLAINVPRWKFLFYLAAAGVAVERVAENAHYFSDVVVGAGVGTFSAYLVHWIGLSLHERKLQRASQADADGREPAELSLRTGSMPVAVGMEAGEG